MRAMRRILLLVCLGAVFETMAASKNGDSTPAPEFTLPDLDAADYQFIPATGKVTYLDFWASWCGPCKISFPDMITLQAEFGTEQLTVITVSVDEKPAAARKFLQRFNTNFTTLIDSSGDVAAKYNLPAMPTTFLIDGDGHIRVVHSGYRPGDIEHLRSAISALLEKNPEQPPAY